MGAVSLGHPDDLKAKLSQEARLSGQGRSQMMCGALEALLSRRQDERAQAALRAAARALANDPGACDVALMVTDDFLSAENEALAGAEESDREGEAEHWWR